MLNSRVKIILIIVIVVFMSIRVVNLEADRPLHVFAHVNDEFFKSGGAIYKANFDTWINDDEKKGAVVIFKDNRAYVNSPGLMAEQKFEHEFAEPGEYNFWWNIAFSGNAGKITVE